MPDKPHLPITEEEAAEMILDALMFAGDHCVLTTLTATQAGRQVRFTLTREANFSPTGKPRRFVVTVEAVDSKEGRDA